MNVVHRSRWFMLIAFVAVLVSIIALGNTASTRRLPPVNAVANAQPMAAITGQSTAVLGTLDIHSFEMGFTPTALYVDQPGRYTIKLINDGMIPHDITFPNGTQVVAHGGETKTVDVHVPTAGLSFICSVPGHQWN